MKSFAILSFVLLVGVLGWSLVTMMPGDRNILGAMPRGGGLAVVHDTGVDLWDGATWSVGPNLGLNVGFSMRTLTVETLPIASVGIASVDGVGYAVSTTYVTGLYWPYYSTLTRAIAFDPVSGVTTEIASPIYRRGFPAVVAHGRRVYKFGGMDTNTGYGKVESEYLDTGTGIWRPIANFPEASYAHIVVAAGSRIYFFGGRTINGAIDNRNRSYDPTANTYAELARIPTTKWRGQQLYKSMIDRAAIVLANGRIALWGGYPHDGITDVYDPGTNTWSVGPAQEQDGAANRISKCFGVPGTDLAIGRLAAGQVHSILSIH
jgi:hypothetical protein